MTIKDLKDGSVQCCDTLSRFVKANKKNKKPPKKSPDNLPQSPTCYNTPVIESNVELLYTLFYKMEQRVVGGFERVEIEPKVSDVSFKKLLSSFSKAGIEFNKKVETTYAKNEAVSYKLSNENLELCIENNNPVEEDDRPGLMGGVALYNYGVKCTIKVRYDCSQEEDVLGKSKETAGRVSDIISELYSCKK